MEVNLKYLDHLQSIITRHNSNSFMIKGWTITIVTAIFALSGALKQPILALVAIVPVLVFWVLDSFYLANERCFVCLYNAAINRYTIKAKNKQLLNNHQVKTEVEKGKFIIDLEKEIEFKTSEYSMDFTLFRKIERNNWQYAFTSKTILWFYLMLLSFSIALFIGLLISSKSVSNEPLKFSSKIETDSLQEKAAQPQVIVNNIVVNDSIIKSDTIKKHF